MMEEAQAIANKLGVTFKLGIDRRIAGAEKIGAHKTSMLQDVEAGRSIELEGLVGSVEHQGSSHRRRTVLLSPYSGLPASITTGFPQKVLDFPESQWCDSSLRAAVAVGSWMQGALRAKKGPRGVSEDCGRGAAAFVVPTGQFSRAAKIKRTG
jgi:hypothetical protein